MVGRELRTMRPTGEDHQGKGLGGGKRYGAIVILLHKHTSGHGVLRSWIRILTTMKGWNSARVSTAMN